MRDLKIFAKTVEQEVVAQVDLLMSQKPFSKSKVRIMPDTHSGKGCVIGFTADLGDKVVPNIVGVDISCGMRTSMLGKVDIDFEKLDNIIRSYIPSGMNTHLSKVVEFPKLKDLKYYNYLKSVSRIECSIGTLGGGNHFIEIDEDSDGNKYLVIHTGSRNLGKQVAEYYQNMAIEIRNQKNNMKEEIESIILDYTEDGKQTEIQNAIKEIKEKYRLMGLSMPDELCYLEGNQREMYLHDMKICQEYATKNRETIENIILERMNIVKLDGFETIHNYIDLESNVIRKGAISAKLGERVLIPINMKDGCILAVGKGNEDWNFSAPHGAGRLMSRKQAKSTLSLKDFKLQMKGVYTTSVNESTLDESPKAYKSMEEITSLIDETVEIIDVLKPMYNFKATE